jgi:hypothetical protein
LELFLHDVIIEYGLQNKINADNNVFCEVKQGMSGLPQAGRLAQELLTKQTLKADYTQSAVTPGFWQHK